MLETLNLKSIHCLILYNHMVEKLTLTNGIKSDLPSQHIPCLITSDVVA